MTRNLRILFVYQILVVFGMLTFVSLGLVFAWALFDREPRDPKRPGLNIKEL